MHIDEIFDLAKQNLMRDGELETTIILVTKTAICACATEEVPADYFDQLDLLLHMGHRLVKRYPLNTIEEIFIVSEAWTHGTFQDDGTPMYQHPTDDPKRREILVVNSFNTATADEVTYSAEIIRSGSVDLLALPQLEKHSPEMLALFTGLRCAHIPDEQFEEIITQARQQFNF